jgi:hypothetical protein
MLIMIILSSAVVLALALFVVIKSTEASINITNKQYESAYNQTKLVAIVTGVLAAISALILGIAIYAQSEIPVV